MFGDFDSKPEPADGKEKAALRERFEELKHLLCLDIQKLCETWEKIKSTGIDLVREFRKPKPN